MSIPQQNMTDNQVIPQQNMANNQAKDKIIPEEKEDDTMMSDRPESPSFEDLFADKMISRLLELLECYINEYNLMTDLSDKIQKFYDAKGKYDALCKIYSVKAIRRDIFNPNRSKFTWLKCKYLTMKAEATKIYIEYVDRAIIALKNWYIIVNIKFDNFQANNLKELVPECNRCSKLVNDMIKCHFLLKSEHLDCLLEISNNIKSIVAKIINANS